MIVSDVKMAWIHGLITYFDIIEDIRLKESKKKKKKKKQFSDLSFLSLLFLHVSYIFFKF